MGKTLSGEPPIYRIHQHLGQSLISRSGSLLLPGHTDPDRINLGHDTVDTALVLVTSIFKIFVTNLTRWIQRKPMHNKPFTLEYL